MLKFNLKEGQVIRKIKVIGNAKQLDNMNMPIIEKHIIWSTLKVLNHFNLLPRGYFTKVSNGNISYKTARKKAIDIMYNQTNYSIHATAYKGKVYLALVEKIISNPELEM